jgi:hypothetical protein
VSGSLNAFLGIRLWIALDDVAYLDRKVRLLAMSFRMQSTGSLLPSERNPSEN